MKKSKFSVFTFFFTLAYCLICFLSTGLILYGAYHGSRSLFQAGNGMAFLWLVNPAGIIVPIIGLIRNRTKWFFLLCMAATTVSWVAAGTMVATVF